MENSVRGKMLYALADAPPGGTFAASPKPCAPAATPASSDCSSLDNRTREGKFSAADIACSAASTRAAAA
jgi:hypothetical protein